ncbi:hypothetical protein D3C78_1198180 [compost metagenome]
MHHQPRIALGLGDVGPVVVDAVAVEGDGGIAEQQGRRRHHALTPLAFRRGLAGAEFRRGRLAVDDVLLLTHGQAAVLHEVVANGDEQQRSGAADLLFDLQNGADPRHLAADTQRFVELEAPAGGHAVATIGWRQETATCRMAIRTEAGLTHGIWLLEESPVPQRRERIANRQVRFVEGRGHAFDHSGIDLLVGLFAAPDPGADSGIAHGVDFREFRGLPKDAIAEAFCEFAILQGSVQDS